MASAECSKAPFSDRSGSAKCERGPNGEWWPCGYHYYFGAEPPSSEPDGPPFMDDEQVVIRAQLSGDLNRRKVLFLTSRGAVEAYQEIKRVIEEAGYEVVYVGPG